jgi:tetratricopeptide (TPR) repeat protein
MDDALSSDEDDDASSGSFLFYDGEGAKIQAIDGDGHSTKKERMLFDFSETLSNLDSLGFGVNVTDNDVEHCDVGNGDASVSKKKRKSTSLSRGDDTDDDSGDPLSTAWWTKDLDAEGWFQHDTTKVYSEKNAPKRLSTGASVLVGEVVDADLNEEFPDDNQERSASGTVVVGGDSQPNSHLDDHSDTSTIDVEDEDIDDWEERLWSVARAHYSQFSGDGTNYIHVDGESVSHYSLLEKKANNMPELDEQSVKDQEQLYLLNYGAEQKGVLVFRSILLQCLETYAKAFHHKVGESKHSCKEGEGDGTSKMESGKSFADFIVPPKVYHYIPMSTARALFLEVIKMADAGQIDTSTFDIKKKANIVTSILVGDALNIFRRYQVITMKTSMKIGSDSKKRRKRLSKGVSKSSDAQAELEDFLYGEMLNADEEQDEVENNNPGVSETKEHEIRLRHDVVRMVLSKSAENGKIISLCWANSVMCKVLLSDIQTITEGTAGCEQDHDDHQSVSVYSQNMPPTLFRTENPMAQLYSLRYTPTFLFRALISQRMKHHVSDSNELYTFNRIDGSQEVTFKDLSDLLFDELYIIKRFELQGPYDATITHLSNWEGAFLYQSSNDNDADEERSMPHSDEKSYESLVALLVSALRSHIKTTLGHTGYQCSGAKQVGDDEDSTNMLGSVKSDVEEYISVHNYANIVANCLEIGRALHHLGVCLGRRQRDGEKLCQKGDCPLVVIEAVDGGNSVNSSLHLEMSSYKNALDAYKGAIFVLTKAENCATLNETTKLGKERRQQDISGELEQERGASKTRRDTSKARDMPKSELHVIREATVSVELHLADTLTCLGYCHDKLSEYEQSLGAYRESLSLYIRHVGRFHKMVSNALHNMGAIHVELGQWKEATSCFRQCLAILKRIKERERMGQLTSQRDQTTNPRQETQQMFVTMQCLGNSLAELGQYDASVACFQEIIKELDANKIEDLERAALDLFAVDVLSQLGRIHLNEAFKQSQAFNWQCHLLLFSESDDKKKDEGLSLTRQINAERIGKDCIMKSILSRRRICYTSPAKLDGGVFSSASNSRVGSSQSLDDSLGFTFRIGAEASHSQMEALAKDLFRAGRIEFRSCSYTSAISYCWESLLLRTLLNSRTLHDDGREGKNYNMLDFNRDLLESEGKVFQVPENILSILDIVDISSIADNAGIEFIQLLVILGVTYTRTRDFDTAQKVMHRAQVLLNPERFSAETGHGAKGTLEEAVLLLDIAFLNLRVGYVDSELGRVESASSNYKEAVQAFKSTASHPIFSSKRKLKEGSGQRDQDVASKITSLYKWQRKKLELALKNGLACALYRLGQNYASQSRTDKAMKCFDDAAHILNESHAIRTDLSNWKTLPLLPFISRCFFEEISVISTSIVLSDVYERSGHISLESGSGRHSFHCFEQAIGIREFVTTTVGLISTLDAENGLECFEETKWDQNEMDCYSAMLLLIEKRELVNDNEASDEMRWKHRDSDQGSENAPCHSESIWTKEDVLFRIGNLQVRGGQFRDACRSYREAEKLTVARLETKDHAIVMNINHNMGNSYRAIAASSLSSESRSAKADALACYLESMRISQDIFGKQHLTYAESMQSLAVLHSTRNLCLAITKEEENEDNDDEVAYKAFKESLSIRRREIGGQNDLEMAFILQQLGDLCLRKVSLAEAYSFDDAETLKLVEDAVSFLSESLDIRQRLLDQNHVSIGETNQSIGIAHLYRAMANADKMHSETTKAFKALTSALEIRRAFSNTFARRTNEPKSCDEHMDSLLMEAHCMFYLGRLEETRSNLEEAKVYYMDAVRLFQVEGKRRFASMNDLEEKLSLEIEAINLWVARVLYHIAKIDKATGSFEHSFICYEEALRIRCQCKSTKKYSLINALINLNLAKALHDDQNYDKSIYCYAKSLRTYLSHYGKNGIDVADTLSGMGKSFVMMSNIDKAMQCYEKAMRIYEYCEGLALKEKKGLLHRDIANIVLEGDILEALEHYRSCVSFLEEFNERHRVTAVFKEKSDNEPNRRLLLYYAEMLDILRQVLVIEQDLSIKAELYDEIGDVLHRLGNLYATFSRYDEAMECFDEVLKAQRETKDDELRIADLLFNMGSINLEQGNPEKSFECLRESYDITKLALGEDNKELHSTLYLMGVAMTNLADYESALKWLSQALSVLRSRDYNGDENVFDEAARGKTLRQMGAVYESRGDQANSLSCFQESVQILKAVTGEDLELSNALNSLGNLLRNASDFEQALDCYDQSLAIRTELGDQLKIANTKNNIGTVLSAMEELDRAMAFSAEALRIKTERLGCDSVETGRALVNVSCFNCSFSRIPNSRQV